MRVFLTVLDSRPTYLRSGAGLSLLQMPVGTGSLLSKICANVENHARGQVTVVADFEPEAGYTAAVRAAAPAVEVVVPAREFAARLQAYEPSDWLLLVDPRCFPVGGLHIEEFLDASGDDPRWVRHLVGLETAPGGTKEFVQTDDEGRVRRIQRYYDFVTWPFASGVACTLLPVASALIARDLPFSSLAALRSALAARGVPSHDLGTPGGYFNLNEEHGLLGLTEHSVLELARADPATLLAAAGATLHPSARVLGPVVLQAGAVVEEGATLVGPSLLGAGCRVGSGATVAHCLVAPGADIPADTSVRERVVQADGVGQSRRSSYSPVTTGGPAFGPVDLSEQRPQRPLYPQAKLFVEVPLACLALLLLSPLLLLIALLVKLESRGPVLYGDKREGRDGGVFRCWKFRSMVQDAHARQRELLGQNQVDGPQFKMDRDPRITRIGRVLRPTSLDELPQLINVAMGQMSFVGPRPSPFRENQMCVPWRDARLSVRPGITGLWQVCRHDRSSGDFHQWIYYDLLYVRHASPLVDLKILAATLITGGGKGCVPLSWILPPHKYHDRRRGRRRERQLAEAGALGRTA